MSLAPNRSCRRIGLAQPFDPRKLETTGPAVPIAAQELDEGPSRREGFSASENGSIVFQSAANSPARMIWFDAHGKELSQLTQAGYRDPSLSPDGALLAVTSDDAHNGKEFIRIIDMRMGIVTRFTDGGIEHNPCWTRDDPRGLQPARRLSTERHRATNITPRAKP